MRYIAISLFDPQKDHLPTAFSGEETTWPPSTAVFIAEKIPAFTTYQLLVPAEHKSAAARLKPYLETKLTEAIKKKVTLNSSVGLFSDAAFAA